MGCMLKPTPHKMKVLHNGITKSKNPNELVGNFILKLKATDTYGYEKLYLTIRLSFHV